MISNREILDRLCIPDTEFPSFDDYDNEDEAFLAFFSTLVLVNVTRGCCVPPKKRGGGGREEEARGFTTVRGAPQNGDGRTCMRQAEPQEILCCAMRVSDLESLFLFFKGVRVASGVQ